MFFLMFWVFIVKKVSDKKKSIGVELGEYLKGEVLKIMDMVYPHLQMNNIIVKTLQIEEMDMEWNHT